MIRVFHVITHLDMGGAEKVAFNIAKSKTSGFEYHIVEVERARGPYSDSLINMLRSDGIYLHRSWISDGKIAIMLFWIRFLFLVLWWKPNVIHSHTEKPDLSIYIWYRLFGWAFPMIKFVRTIHNTQLWNDWKGIGKKVEAFFKKMKSNIAISESTQSYYVKNYGGKIPPIIYNGLEEKKQKEFNGLDHSKINVLFAGRLEHQKGVEVMVNIFRKYADNDRFRLFVIGSGSLHTFVLDSLGSFEHVKIIDKVYDLSSYLGSFDYLFMPSIHEGLALMSIEASMAKTPTIINKSPGLKDTLPSDWPLAVMDNDNIEYSMIFEKLPTLNKQELGEVAYKFAKKNFDIRVMQLAYEDIYRAIC